MTGAKDGNSTGDTVGRWVMMPPDTGIWMRQMDCLPTETGASAFAILVSVAWSASIYEC